MTRDDPLRLRPVEHREQHVCVVALRLRAEAPDLGEKFFIERIRQRLDVALRAVKRFDGVDARFRVLVILVVVDEVPAIVRGDRTKANDARLFDLGGLGAHNARVQLLLLRLLDLLRGELRELLVPRVGRVALDANVDRLGVDLLDRPTSLRGTLRAVRRALVARAEGGMRDRRLDAEATDAARNPARLGLIRHACLPYPPRAADRPRRGLRGSAALGSRRDGG